MFDVLVNGIPLVAVVLGLVEISKRLGVEGKGAVITSLLIGLVLGIAYQLSVAIPTDFAGYFGAAIYGLALGLTASGIYDVVTRRSLEKKTTPFLPADHEPYNRTNEPI